MRITKACILATLTGAVLAGSAALGAKPDSGPPEPTFAEYLCHVPKEGLDKTMRIEVTDGQAHQDRAADWMANQAGRCFDTHGSSQREDLFELLVCHDGPGRSMGLQVEIGPTGRVMTRSMGCGSPEWQ